VQRKLAGEAAARDMLLGDQQRVGALQLLQERREAAIEAMRFLDRFDPRLVGAVLEGTADAHSAVCLHVFSDTSESVVLFLQERGVPITQQTRRLRVTRDEQKEYPVLLFAADGLPFDITVLPRDALKQAPLDRIDEKPMRRASLAAVEEMVATADNDDNFEKMLSSALR